MYNLIETINWAERSPLVDVLFKQGSALSISPMAGGLEAEVVKIDTPDSSFVLKIWNRDSRPNIERQFKLLHALHKHGLPVSAPYGWGVDREGHSVLLTSFDGTPVAKVNQRVLSSLAQMMTAIYRLPADELGAELLPKYDFTSYFFPSVKNYEDIGELLSKLVKAGQLKQDTFIHGDFNLGNVLHADGQYSVIDWTNGQLGDARYDAAWSIFLIRIYVSDRNGETFASLLSEHFGTSSKHFGASMEQQLFEAIACLRWLLLDRMVGLPRGKDTVKRVKSILNKNPYLNEQLLVQHSSDN